MVTISDVMKMKESRDIDGLIQALQDPDISVRAEAASSLGALGDPNAVVPLISTLQNDSDPYVRSLAAKSLGFLGDPRASDPLMNALANDTIEVSAVASTALGQVQAAAVTGRSVTGKQSPAAPKGSEAASSAPSQVQAAASPKESEAKGCAWKLWRTIYVVGIILVITGVLTVGLFLYSMLSGSAVGDWTGTSKLP